MTQPPPARQRSFRWSAGVLDELEARAAAGPETANALAERLLREGLRTERHPLITFRLVGEGRRLPGLAGTRLAVWQVVRTIRDSGNDLRDAAEYLSLTRAQVDAVAAYYAEFRNEVDADEAMAVAFSERERARWEQAENAFA
jgi:uncharacterized protein (DUF433 family)